MIDHSIKKLRIIDLGLSKFYFPEDSNMRVGSLSYMSPELIVDYPKYDLSVDMWAFGCILAGWLFRVNIFFKPAVNEEHQILSIAKVLGSQGLVDYTNKYQLTLFTKVYDYYNSSNSPPIPKIPWEYFINDDNRAFATKDGLDLLSRLLVYDHTMRISAKDAMRHPYFRDVRVK
jgi:casein kinase II subunit alpha